MSEVNLLEAAKQLDIKSRREARQRKILENAKTRLEKLNGRESKLIENGDVAKTKEIYPDPEIERETLSDFTPNFQQYSARNLNSFDFNDNSQDILGIFNQFLQVPQENNGSTATNYQKSQAIAKKSNLVKFLEAKLHLVLIAFITYFLIITQNEKFIFYNVFFPLFAWEVAEVFLLKSYEQQSGSIASLVLLMAGFSPVNSKALMKIIETLNKIFQDVGVFIFMFVTCHIFRTGFDCFGGNENITLV